MADQTTGTIPQNAATTPIAPEGQTAPTTQDLQINLDVNEQNGEASKIEEKTTPENKESDLNFDLDLNLSDAPKDDDRLKDEDQKNINAPEQAMVNPVAEEQPVVETTREQTIEQTVEIPVIEEIPEAPTEEVPVIKEIPEIKTEEIVKPTTTQSTPVDEVPVAETPDEQPVVEEAIQQPAETPIIKTTPEIPSEEVIAPATKIESEPITAEATAELKEDMNIINELEGHASAGGLSPEATINPQPTPVEPPKTFDLDAMLGTTAAPQTAETIPQPVSMEMPMPQATVAPIIAPAFTIPTAPAQSPVQSVVQPLIPQKKASSVKILLFVIMFVALGFTTFFILKTMYPIEFGNMFGSGNEIQTSTIEEATGTELSGMDLSGGENEEISGTLDTGSISHESALDSEYGELNGLGEETTAPEENNVSKLTDYVTKGNDLLAQGKAIGNNTVIKYGLYISKKSTAFLEKIANGEEINNLSGYFAQFDQYITELEGILGNTNQNSSSISETSNESGMTETGAPTPIANSF